MTNEEKINLIGQKILLLSNNLEKYQSELNLLKQQLDSLQGQTIRQHVIVPPVVKSPEPKIVIEEKIEKPEIKVEIPEIKIETPEVKPQEIPVIKIQETIKQPIHQQFQIPPQALKPKQPSDFNFEAFVGGKLLTIIGIIILVIGLAIGVKYAIDNDLLGPLARIVLAYIAGGILLVLALKLKANYKAFSSVILSGGMASLYFTTFAAYTMYGMFGQVAAFGIMVVFTLFTVFAATVYEMEVIGIIGLVGAYAVPMLLSDGSGKIEIMFSYMLIVNSGILILSFKKYWQVLNHISFGFTWLIVLAWFTTKYYINEPTAMILSFSFLFFLIFYISNMAYKIVKKEKFAVLDIIRIVANSFIFFGIGYAAMAQNEQWKDYLGIFTVANALVHFVFSYIVFTNKLLDRKLFYLLIALVLSFITIAIPVQLEGNWVTLLWSAEAVLLFSLGRYKAVRFYEWLAYIMILLSIFSLVQDWEKSYYFNTYSYETYGYGQYFYKYWTPFTNIYLFTSLFVCASLGSIIYVHHKKEITFEERTQFGIYRVTEYVLPILLFIITYFTFHNEISAYYQSLYEKSLIKVPSKEAWAEQGAVNEVYDYSLLKVRNVALGAYDLVFFIVFTILAITKLKTPVVRWSSFGTNMLIAMIFISLGLNELGDLRNVYLSPNENTQYYTATNFIYYRYGCIFLFAVLLWLTHILLKTETFRSFVISRLYAGCFVHFFIIIVLSNELVNIQILRHGDNFYYAGNAVYKLGFTALWGLYSFVLIAWGMFKKNSILRISAISLFGITLIKLVTFDTWALSTGYKVIAYMLLGVILLVVAFLYQKFKTLIFGDDTQNEIKN